MKPSKKSMPVKVLYWSSQVSSISIEVALMTGLGYFADQYFGTTPILLLVGCFLGFGIAMWHLYQLVKALGSDVDL